jgi:hypothetical protein
VYALVLRRGGEVPACGRNHIIRVVGSMHLDVSYEKHDFMMKSRNWSYDKGYRKDCRIISVEVFSLVTFTAS